MIAEFVGGSRDGLTLEIPDDLSTGAVFKAPIFLKAIPHPDDYPCPNFSETVGEEVYVMKEFGKLLFCGWVK